MSLGALGAGGSILLLPMLVHVAHYPVKQAIPMSLAVAAFASLAGAAASLRRGDLSFRLLLVFGLGGIGGAFTGSQFTHLVSPLALMTIFSVLLAAVGVATLRQHDALLCANPCLPPRCFAIAFAIGLLTGFLGVGGGFLLVPALMRFAGLTARRAAGTSLALIALNSIAGMAGQLRFASCDWRAVVWFSAAATCGVLVGLWLSRLTPRETFRTAFVALLIAIAALNFLLLSR